MRVLLMLCWVLAVGALVASGGAARAAAPSPTPKHPPSGSPALQGTLTMDQAVQTALRESPVVRGAVAEVEAAIGQLGVARANTSPIVSANAFAGGGSLGNLFATTAPVMPQMIQTVGPGGFFDQNFTLMYPLYTGGRLRALVRQAEAARRAESADLESVRLEVATMTRMAYRQAQYQHSLLTVHEAVATAHRERLRTSQTALDAGKVPQFYVLRDEAELANAEQQLTNARRDAEQAMVALKTWMGVSLASPIQLAEPAPVEPMTRVLARWGVRPEAERELGGFAPGAPGGRASEASLESLLRLAEQQRPELAAARERLAGGREGARAARGLYQPQIGVGAMADFMQTRDRDFLGGTTFGVVASLPILDGGLRRSQVRAAEAERERLAQEAARLTLQVQQEVTNAWLALQAAAQNVHTAEAGLRSAQEDYRVTQIRYEAGKGINLEVLDAITARTRAETNRAQALYEYGVAQDQLQRAVGSASSSETLGQPSGSRSHGAPGFSRPDRPASRSTVTGQRE